MHWLVIGGTSESVEAAAYLTSKGTRVTVSVATDMVQRCMTIFR